jgi:hypothetical protein
MFAERVTKQQDSEITRQRDNKITRQRDNERTVLYIMLALIHLFVKKK